MGSGDPWRANRTDNIQLREIVRRAFTLALMVCILVVACGGGSDPTSEAPATAAPTQPASEESSSPGLPRLDVLPSPTPYASAMPLPTPRGRLMETYVVQAGDTLGGISLAFDVPLEELVALNGLGSEAAIIHAGQALRVPLNITRTGPQVTLLPDSEVVFSPAYRDFDVAGFVAQQGGYLAEFSTPVNDIWISGAEAVSRVARQYSVGPRVLLTLLEYYGGWVTQSPPPLYTPLGTANPYYDESFYLQLSWAANRVNEGYYGYQGNGNLAVHFGDGERALVPAGLNAGSAGIFNILALNGDWETWETERQDFMETYRRLFGDPLARTFAPLVPSDLAQPALRLPWQAGETFYYTGGPHAAYGSRSTWAAVDFAPPDIKGSCYYSQKDVTAAADARLYLAGPGEMYLDLDADGNLQTGWVLLYLHVVARDELTHGQLVTAGTPLGYASCEGGVSNSSHVHLARRFNGEWLAADGPIPLVLSGWQFKASGGQYDGTAVRDGVTKTACECWDEVMNALVGE
jgi:LasA protease